MEASFVPAIKALFHQMMININVSVSIVISSLLEKNVVVSQKVANFLLLIFLENYQENFKIMMMRKVFF